MGAYHPGAGPLSDTDEIPTGAVRDEREPASADGYEDAYDDGDDDYEDDGGLFEWIWDHWYVLLMVAAVALVAVIVAGKTFGGGEEADAPPAPAGTQTETRNVAPETAAPLRRHRHGRRLRRARYQGRHLLPARRADRLEGAHTEDGHGHGGHPRRADRRPVQRGRIHPRRLHHDGRLRARRARQTHPATRPST